MADIYDDDILIDMRQEMSFFVDAPGDTLFNGSDGSRIARALSAAAESRACPCRHDAARSCRRYHLLKAMRRRMLYALRHYLLERLSPL